MQEDSLDEMEFITPSMFGKQNYPMLTIMNYGIKFNYLCLEGLNFTEHIRIKVDGVNQVICISECPKDNDYAIKWCNIYGDKKRPRKLSGKFADLIYKMMHWDVRNRYYIRAVKEFENDEEVYKFYLKNAETKEDVQIERIVKLLSIVDGVVIPKN